MLPLLLSFGTFVSTLLGGTFAIRFRSKARLLLGFMAGFLLGVVAFEVLPEIIHQVSVFHLDATEIMAALVFGFLSFHVAEKLIVLHHAHEADYAAHHHPRVGMLSALAFVAHSVMDGVSIGLGFQVSSHVGLMVAVAVISHDFTDGMNTATVMLRHRNSTAKAVVFLVLDALAPIAGLLITLAITFSARWLALYLGVLAGFLLYIGASDILPEAHSPRASGWAVVMTVAGSMAAFVLSRFI